MTVSTSYSVLTYTGDGSTTNFSVTWPFFTGTLVVTEIVIATGVETVKTLDTHYTVTGGTDANGLPSTGTVVANTAPASTVRWRISRTTPKTQASTWGETDNFPQKTFEAALDKQCLINQEVGDVSAYASAASASATAAATSATEALGAIVGFKWTYATSTVMGDPGTGGIRFNNAAWASVTAIAIADTSADTGNPDVSAFVATWDDSDNSIRGTLVIRKGTPSASFVVYSITGVSTDNTGWTQLAVTHVAGNPTFAASDELIVAFARSGNKGQSGAGTGDMVGANNLSDVTSISASRTTLGLGTGDSPMFTGVNIGHATDSTVTRVSAGVLAIEGNNILTADVIGTTVQGYDAATIKSNATAAITAGYTEASYDAGVKSSGSFTPDPTLRNIQHFTNSGAFSLLPPASHCSIILDQTNGASAGTITRTGFTKVTGDTLTTTNGHKFRHFITVGNGGSHCHSQALQ